MRGTSSDLPLPVFELLVEKYPEALQETNNKGYLPLHCAVENEYSVRNSKELIRFILGAYPEASKHKSCSGQLPLHLACSAKIRWNWADERMEQIDIFNILMEVNPRGQTEYDNQGHLPFHISCLKGNALAIEYWIKQMDKRSTLPLTKNGTHPLFLACEHNEKLDVVWELFFHSLELLTGGC